MRVCISIYTYTVCILCAYSWVCTWRYDTKFEDAPFLGVRCSRIHGTYPAATSRIVLCEVIQGILK